MAAAWEQRERFDERLIEEFRATRLVCPVMPDGALWGAETGGIHWLYAFTSERALAEFARARGAGREPWQFARIEGGRLLDLAVPAAGCPAGVAIDVASQHPMLLPPVEGIVPEGAVAR